MVAIIHCQRCSTDSLLLRLVVLRMGPQRATDGTVIDTSSWLAPITAPVGTTQPTCSLPHIQPCTHCKCRYEISETNPALRRAFSVKLRGLCMTLSASRVATKGLFVIVNSDAPTNDRL